MKKASIPNFENQNHEAGGGIPILKTMWDKFGFSHLFLSIDKHSGLSAWKLVFAYITVLVANCSSVNRIAEHCTNSPIIREILCGISLSQLALSRFFSKDFDWQESNINRIKASHRVAFKNTLQLYFDTSCIKFASFIKKFWPRYYDLGFGRTPYHLLYATA